MFTNTDFTIFNVRGNLKKKTIIDVILLATFLAFIVLILTLIFIKKEYITNKNELQILLNENQSINQVFSGQEKTINYMIDGKQQKIQIKGLCNDCKQQNVHNRGSALILEAPDSICDVDVESCIMFKYDPFGFGQSAPIEIIRSVK